MNILHGIEELVGKTPLVELTKIEEKYQTKASILAKLEKYNPTGSSKDRAALYMINEAEKQGLITKGATIIEPTSGNTGIGLSAICAKRGYKAIIVMPDSMSIERQRLMKAYGAKVVLTEGKQGMKGCLDKTKELLQEIPNSFCPSQFDNPANPLSHYETTAPEIWNDTDGKVDIFVAGIGTGGTISGIGKYLKEKNPKIQIIGFEPSSSPLITTGVAGSHKIQGIGANFVPSNFQKQYCDEVITVDNQDAYEMGRVLAKTEGIFLGISSGACLSAALTLSKRPENKGKIIVALMPDSGDHYLSTDGYIEEE
jgi:cysteine synthase A